MNRASKRTATKRVLSTVAMATGILLSGSTAQGEPKAPEPVTRHAEIAVASGPTTNKQTSWSENTGEVLYNGIRLPAVWPPQRLEPSSAEAMPVPYLEHRPTVIPIDIGRQLFVDDFLIEETSLKRTFYQAKKYEGNPVFKPETPGEVKQLADVYLGHGGVFFDPADQVFKMFYVAGWRGGLALATSKDMIHWTRPNLGLAGGNLLLPQGDSWTGPQLKSGGTDNCVWLDLNTTNAEERIKFLTCWIHAPKNKQPKGGSHSLHVSDGKVWSEGVLTGSASDYCSFFYNPFRNVWVFSIKQDGPRGRCRYYSENADFLKGATWSQSVYWTNADRLDQPEPKGSYPGAGEAPQLYSLNAVAYESLMVGMHYIHRGPNNEVCDKGKFPKLVDLELGFSRDGFHWLRPDRQGFIAGTRKEGAWDRAYLHSTAGVCVILDDTLVFPYTGFSGIAPDGSRGMYTGASVGLALLRRDGFASMDAGEKPGTLTTRPLTFSGSHLFVNVACQQGELRTEILDTDGNVIVPFSASKPISVDKTLHRVEWPDAKDLSPLARKPVRFRFSLRNGSLYAFWVSPSTSGASGGYLAAGGPGYPGIADEQQRDGRLAPRDGDSTGIPQQPGTPRTKRSLLPDVSPAQPAPEARFAAMTSDELRAYERDTLQRVADLSLIPPTINTRPLPQYDYDQLDYGMTISIERTPGGRLWAVWVGGEDGPKAFMVAATSDDDGETWSKPRLAVDSQSPTLPIPRSVIVGNLWTDPRGRLWFFFDQTMNHYDGRQGVWVSICENPDAAEPVWLAPRRIWHGAVLNKPTVLANGEWWLPVEFPAFDGFGPMRYANQELEPLRGANVFVSTDQGQSWTRRGCVRFPKPCWDEHMFVELKDGRVWMLARTRDGTMQSFSSDGGKTWTDPTFPTFKHPAARFHIRRLASGRILLVKHGQTIDAHEGRSKLTAWLSEDEGQTWKGGLMLDERSGISYPDGFQAPDGTLYISYDRNRSTDGEVLLARFTEDDILAKRLVGQKSKLKLLISKPLKNRKPARTK